jgi:hypothetical protein
LMSVVRYEQLKPLVHMSLSGGVWSTILLIHLGLPKGLRMGINRW